MKKLFVLIFAGLLISSIGKCMADEIYYVSAPDYKPTFLDKMEDTTQDLAETIGSATSDAAKKTGHFIKEKSITAADATGKAVKNGAKKAGCATKKGAKKAIVALARKLLVIIYTMLKQGTLFDENNFEARRKSCEDRQVNRYRRELERRGYRVEFAA